MEDFVFRRMAVNVRYNANKANIFKTFHTYFAEEDFVDLILICNRNVSVKAHKMVVCAVSDFLKDIIEDSGQGIAYISLPDVSHIHMKLLLAFLYEGELTVTCEELNELQNIIAFLGMFLPDVAAVAIDSTPFVNVNLDVNLSNPVMSPTSNMQDMDDPLQEPSDFVFENTSHNFPELPSPQLSDCEDILSQDTIIPSEQERMTDKIIPPENETAEFITNDNDITMQHCGLTVKQDVVTSLLKDEVDMHEGSFTEANVSSLEPEGFVVPNEQTSHTSATNENISLIKQKRDRPLRKMERPLRKSERPMKKKFILIKGKIFETAKMDYSFLEFPFKQQEFSDSSPDSSVKSTTRATTRDKDNETDTGGKENLTNGSRRKSIRTSKKKFIISKGKIFENSSANVQSKATKKTPPQNSETYNLKKMDSEIDLGPRRRGRSSKNSLEIMNGRELPKTNSEKTSLPKSECETSHAKNLQAEIHSLGVRKRGRPSKHSHDIACIGDIPETNSEKTSPPKSECETLHAKNLQAETHSLGVRKRGRPSKHSRDIPYDGEIPETNGMLDETETVPKFCSRTSILDLSERRELMSNKATDSNAKRKRGRPMKIEYVLKDGKLYKTKSAYIQREELNRRSSVEDSSVTSEPQQNVKEKHNSEVKKEHPLQEKKLMLLKRKHDRALYQKSNELLKKAAQTTRMVASYKTPLSFSDVKKDVQPKFEPEHRPSRLNSFKHKCRHCGKLFMMTDKLKAHMLIHGDIDTKSSSTISSPVVVNGHGSNKSGTVQDQTPEKNHPEKRTKCRYPCNKCEVTCYSRTSYFHHQSLHNRVRPFHCVKCDKAFIRSADLKSHMYVHTNIRPHACNLCDKRFKMKKHLKTHMILLHHKSP